MGNIAVHIVIAVLVILCIWLGGKVGYYKSRNLRDGEYEDFIRKYCSWQPAREEWKINYGGYPKYYKSSGLYDAFLYHKKS